MPMPKPKLIPLPKPKLRFEGLLIEETTTTRVMTGLLLSDSTFMLGDHMPQGHAADTDVLGTISNPPRHVATLLVLGAERGLPANAVGIMGAERATAPDATRKFVLKARPRSYIFAVSNFCCRWKCKDFFDSLTAANYLFISQAPDAETAGRWVDAVSAVFASMPPQSRFDQLNVGPVWEEDKHATACRLCSGVFNEETRCRYHCRFCGQVFLLVVTIIFCLLD